MKLWTTASSCWNYICVQFSLAICLISLIWFRNISSQVSAVILLPSIKNQLLKICAQMFNFYGWCYSLASKNDWYLTNFIDCNRHLIELCGRPKKQYWLVGRVTCQLCSSYRHKTAFFGRTHLHSWPNVILKVWNLYFLQILSSFLTVLGLPDLSRSLTLLWFFKLSNSFFDGQFWNWLWLSLTKLH